MRFKKFLSEASDSEYVNFLEIFFQRPFIRSEVKNLGFIRNYSDMLGRKGILFIDSKTGEKILMSRPIQSDLFQYPELLSWLLKLGAREIHDKEEIINFVGSGFPNIVEK